MKNIFPFLLVLIFFISCMPEKKVDASRFKLGTFIIPSGEGYGKTIIKRVDSLQIETYTREISISNDTVNYKKELTHTDTLFITWKNNFAYTLKMKNPKKDIDKDPIFVQITKVTDTSYNFRAKIGYSNFKQDGTVYILNNK